MVGCTARNYVFALRLFCEENNIPLTIPWKQLHALLSLGFWWKGHSGVPLQPCRQHRNLSRSPHLDLFIVSVCRSSSIILTTIDQSTSQSQNNKVEVIILGCFLIVRKCLLYHHSPLLCVLDCLFRLVRKILNARYMPNAANTQRIIPDVILCSSMFITAKTRVKPA